MILESVGNEGRMLEFYIYTSEGKYGLIKEVPIPNEYSIGSIRNINLQNTPDILFFDNKTKNLKIFLSNFDE